MQDPRNRPIGVFDSGVGGLSVLRALWSELPAEDYVYLADAGHAPYGEKSDGFVLERAQDIARQLTQRFRIKALVVACNTATAAAIAQLRADHPDLPIVGIEPAIKPALGMTRTGRIGVMATRGTLQSEKFRQLMHQLQQGHMLELQPCDGLADAIERNDAIKVEALCKEYTRAIGRFGTQAGECDTLVLGCTHYPFALDVLRKFCGAEVHFLEGGVPVARRTRQLLTAAGLLGSEGRMPYGATTFMTTGTNTDLADALERWLGVRWDGSHSATNRPRSGADSTALAKESR